MTLRNSILKLMRPTEATFARAALPVTTQSTFHQIQR